MLYLKSTTSTFSIKVRLPTTQVILTDEIIDGAKEIAKKHGVKKFSIVNAGVARDGRERTEYVYGW